MTKKFIKDNRGQVLYAVIVTVMFMGVLSMIAMGMTLKNYQSAVKKQENLRNYYAADAVVEKIRVGAIEFKDDSDIRDEEYGANAKRLEKGDTETVSETETNSQEGDELTKTKETISIHKETYQVTCETTIITVTMNVMTTKIQTSVTVVEDGEPVSDPQVSEEETHSRTIISWEVSYNAG